MSGMAIIGTTSSHGGAMISASAAHFATSGGAACVVGDSHSCPIPGHGVTAITSGGTSNATAGGLAIAKAGSVAACGAVLNGNFAANISIT